MGGHDVRSEHPRAGGSVVRRLLAMAAVVAASVVVPLANLSAQAGPLNHRPTPHKPAGGEIGIAPPHRAASTTASPSGGNMSYHSGRVLTTNNVYVIYWAPAGVDSVVTTKVFGRVGSTYRSLVTRFFQDVAHDNGKTSNVYYSATQYSSSAGNIKYTVNFHTPYLDRHGLPLSGCTNSVTTWCLSNQQLKDEIARDVKENAWVINSNSVVFLFTGYGIGSCYDSTLCSFGQYCAYHANITINNVQLQFANMPYMDTLPYACDSGNYPNSDQAADSAINMASHEHLEAITDPTTSAWYDSRGAENGDKCVWNFGTILGGTIGHKYNQVINGHHYYLQGEWSNRRSACVQTGT